MTTYNTLDPTSNTESDDTYLLMQNGINRLQTRGILSASLDQGQWQNSFDYSINDITRGTDGKRYIALESSGPNTANGVVDPVTGSGGVWFDCTDILNGTSVPEKATTADVQAGTDDEKYVTSKGVNDALDMVGFVLYRSVSTAPAGRWIKANGFEISRTAYSDLFAEASASDNFISQTTKDADPETYTGYYGDGDGSTTFTLPDLRAEVIRGADSGRGVDTGREFGSFQGDAIRNISGRLGYTQYGYGELSSVYEEGPFYESTDTGMGSLAKTESEQGRAQGFDASRQVPTANENRMRNIAYTAWIRY